MKELTRQARWRDYQSPRVRTSLASRKAGQDPGRFDLGQPGTIGLRVPHSLPPAFQPASREVDFCTIAVAGDGVGVRDLLACTSCSLL